MDARWMAAGILLIGGFLLLGFAGSTDLAAGPGERSAPVQAPPMPDTTGEAVWAHLQEGDYRESWELWPGTSELYEGQEPHGMQLTTYVNDPALQALEEGENEMPSGAVVVKEN